MFRVGMSKGPLFKLKAAEGRNMLGVVHATCTFCFPKDSPHAVLRLQCLSRLKELHEIMVDWDAAVSPPLLATAGEQYLLLYAELSKEALAVDEFSVLWALVPKHHLLIHCVTDQVDKHGNPRESWAYWDESEIGLAAASCVRLHPSTLHRTLISRYRCTEV